MSTTLCQHCQAISLDDEKLGGTTFTSDDGEPFLYFGRDVEGSEGHFSIKVPGDREDELPDLPRLQLSAANGCSLCGLLRSAVLSKLPSREVDREGPDTSGKMVVFKNFEYHWHSLELHFWQDNSLAYLAFLSVNTVVQGLDDEQCPHIYFEVCAPPGPLGTWLRIPWNVSDDNALLPARIRVIKSWIADCEQNCHYENITTALPSRLIEVKSEDGKDHLRLVLSSDIPTIHRGATSCKYTTLSYCWGDRTSKPFFTTEKSTLQQLLQSIPMESIPCTFRDAVVVTRSLGIRYLWIDALCIVQDDSEDWAKESAIMGRIYTNSYVTLIALQGESCHDGLLDRVTAREVPIYYKSSLKPHVNGIYCLRQVSCGYAHVRGMMGKFATIMYDWDNSRWCKRGWTLQEDRLSARKLMFGAERMYYECRSGFWTENMHGVRTRLGSWSRPFLDCLSEDPSPRNVYIDWYAGVELFSGRDLTYHTDRLPAISGLAERIYERMAGNYLAGLWQSDLLNGLLWVATPWKRPVRRGAAFIDSVVHPRHYIAPSWSWARSQQSICFVCYAPPYANIVSEIEVLEARTDLTGPNPFGGVQGGHLLFRGKTFGLQGARIFGVDGKKVDFIERVQGSIWLEVISQNGSEIARCVLDWETPEVDEDLKLCEAPWDQLMMLITASYPIDSDDPENDEDEEYKEDDEAKEEGKDESNKGDGDDMGDEDEDRKSVQDEEDSIEEDEEHNSPEEPRVYHGLLLLPTSEEADSWVRIGIFMLENDKPGRAVLENCSERVVKVV